MHTSSRSFIHFLMFSLCATSLTAACSDKHLTGGLCRHADEIPSRRRHRADAGEIPTSADTGVVLGGVDSDGDGFSDAVERSAGKELGINFGEWGASPDHKDVFLYMDYYDQPDDDAIQDVVTAFANAPVTNPDG